MLRAARLPPYKQIGDGSRGGAANAAIEAPREAAAEGPPSSGEAQQQRKQTS